MTDPKKVFYESSNGDNWALARNPDSGLLSVRHQPNEQSGGKTSYVNVDEFLRQSPAGPQHDALYDLIESKAPLSF